MLDFMIISTRVPKKGLIEIYPKFVARKSQDLMIRGGDFYAVWIEEKGLWSTDEDDVIRMVDEELKAYADKFRKETDDSVYVKYMWDCSSGVIDSWHKYCQRQMRDSFHILDEKLIFSNDVTKKTDYASKKLDYPLEPGDISAYDKLMSILYSPEERHKIEWVIGSIVTGDSKKIQKFMVMYGAAGTGKSTVINIIQNMFSGYYSVFDAKALGSSSNQFALESFKSNPLVAIQHDGDLSRIEDNTRLNSVVSHELMTVNEKFKSSYSSQFKCFLIMGTNKPVKITDAKSGLMRRLIDVSPTGNKIGFKEYNKLVKKINFELGAIACHCRDVYLEDPEFYDNYIPMSMLGASNDFYNFMEEFYPVFKNEDGTTLKAAWEMYKTYCDEAKVLYPLPQRAFKEELKNYFRDYKDRRYSAQDGGRIRCSYSGFRLEKFDKEVILSNIENPIPKIIQFDSIKSIFDEEFSDCYAQYASDRETPQKKWSDVETKLSELDTSKVHYVKVPENHIVIDFDIPDENGNKSVEKNMEEASKWPDTYGELSKSGNGVHLHYIYNGDVSKLSRIYDDHIEIKVFTGKSSLRRKLTKCNNIPIATISSGLPLKGEKNVVNFDAIKNEKGIRTLIKKNLNKEIHPATKPSIDFINKILNDAYNGGMKYDVTDMRQAILSFAAQSTNQSDYCIKLVNKMKFKSEEPSDYVESESEIVFYDVEVFPNLFLVNYKFQGEDKKVMRMINPTPSDIEGLLKYRLIGFNNRRYDNHILYARLIGYTNEQLFNLSTKIVSKSKNCFFSEAYNLSYTDVYDFSSAQNKKSLKKWEIELDIHHQELGLPWDKPVPEELWPKVAEYCDNDVIATEVVFNHLKSDWKARQILAEVAGMTVNDTTNSLSTKIIFGNNRKPQDQFNYRDMGDTSEAQRCTVTDDLVLYNEFGSDEYTAFDKQGRPVFPGYKYERGVSTYRGEEVGEGGYVYAEPGMYVDVALLDIASMHPSSIIAEMLFGEAYTARFREIRDSRIYIKHKDFDKARTMLGGALSKYLDDEEESTGLALAMKTAINSVYGLTSASFENPFRDPRNIDNIVAKRGALFMINLKHEVQKRGFTVAHIKTDSIKIPNATPEIIKFVMDYGKQYGYDFEHEATYERMCLVNNSVYIAKYKDGKHAGEWTATGTQFQIPYVFKKLFSKEPILFKDRCETKSVTTSMYLDMNESLPEGEHNYVFVGKVGNFCPIKSGFGGGELLREGKDKEGNIKYSSATGAKGYRWLESEMVKELGKENDIENSYYDALADEAIEAISIYGDFEWFVSEDK